MIKIKRLRGIIMTAVLLAAMLPATALAAQTRDAGDPTALATALSAAQDGDTIRLTADISFTSAITINGKAITFDLNGYTLNVTVSSGNALTVRNHGKVILAPGGGELNVKTTGNDAYGVYVQDNNSSATVTNARGEGEDSCGATAFSGGSITVLNNATASGTYSAGAYTNGTGATITVKGNATATGEECTGAYADGENTITIDGDATASGGSWTSGVFAEDGATVTVGGNVSASGSSSIGAYTYWGGTVTVGRNATATGDNSTGARCMGTIVVSGNVTADGSNSTGASVYDGATVTIDGIITAVDYIKLQGRAKAQNEMELTTSKPGYYTYTDNTSTVWVKIPATLDITTGTLPAAEVGAAYSQTVAVNYTGTGVLTYSAEGLPAGLSINTHTGVISGTPAAGTGADSPYAVTVNVTDGTLADSGNFSLAVTEKSTISPVSAGFDKKPSAQVDVQVTMTLNGNTLSSIYNGASKLTESTDYTVLGTTVTISKSYLATLATGAATLTFNFSAGGPQSLSVTISDSSDTTKPTVVSAEPNGSGASVSGSLVITFSEAMDTAAGTVSLGGASLAGGSWSGSQNVYTAAYSGLAHGAGYTINISGFKDIAGNTMDADGSHGFTTASETIGAVISPISVSYDLAHPGDVSTAVTWNSAGAVTDVARGSEHLASGDYSINGNTLTISNAYLAARNFSANDRAVFTISFDIGDPASLTVEIVNNYAPGSNAALSDLTVGGRTVSGFASGNTEYNVELPYGTQPGSDAAKVGAAPADPKATVGVTQTPALPGNATVVVTAEDKATANTYTVHFTLGAPPNPPPQPHTITVMNDGNGQGSSSAASAVSGTTVTLAAAPNSGYRFKEWRVVSPSSLGIRGNGFTMPDEAVTVMAIFEKNAPATYTVTVDSGTGSGSYAKGAAVSITADAPPEGKVFDEWTTGSGGVAFDNAQSYRTTFIMPDHAVVVTATYRDSVPASSAKVITIVQTPDVPNPELITVEPVGDAFNQPVEVRIQQSTHAGDMVRNAMRNGSSQLNFDDMQIFPLDISMYIAGTDTRVQPREGTAVRITIPIPPELLASKDKLVVVCVTDGKLTLLPATVVMKNGVDCVEFTATHFSPYALVIDKDGSLSDLNASKASPPASSNSLPSATPSNNITETAGSSLLCIVWLLVGICIGGGIVFVIYRIKEVKK